jgi:hypothetical protein
MNFLNLISKDHLAEGARQDFIDSWVHYVTRRKQKKWPVAHGMAGARPARAGRGGKGGIAAVHREFMPNRSDGSDPVDSQPACGGGPSPSCSEDDRPVGRKRGRE